MGLSALLDGSFLDSREQKEKDLREREAQDRRDAAALERKQYDDRLAAIDEVAAHARDVEREAAQAKRAESEAKIAAQAEARGAEIRLLQDRVGFLREAVPSVPAVVDAETARQAVEAQALRSAAELLLQRAESALTAAKRR
jgi:hypothetical protein